MTLPKGGCPGNGRVRKRPREQAETVGKGSNGVFKLGFGDMCYEAYMSFGFRYGYEKGVPDWELWSWHCGGVFRVRVKAGFKELNGLITLTRALG